MRILAPTFRQGVLLALLLCAVAALDGGDVCPGGLTWSGVVSGTSQPPRSMECVLPKPFELADAFAARRIHTAGDSTVRMPVQHFQHAVIGCSPKSKPNPRYAKRKSDEEFCKSFGSDNNGKTLLLLERPLGSFGLTYEPWQHVEGACAC
jgi:hypothetical protein